MNEQTTLFLGPEENLAILKGIFSSRKSSVEGIARITGKKKGTVNNSIHDLRILFLIDDDLKTLEEAKNVVYDRNAKQILKEMFMKVHGHKEATDEVNAKEKINPLLVGKIFCYHTNARATKESSIKQIGRLYLRWLKFLNIFEKKEKEDEDENGS